MPGEDRSDHIGDIDAAARCRAKDTSLCRQRCPVRNLFHQSGEHERASQGHIRLDGSTYAIRGVNNDTDEANGVAFIISDLTIVSPEEAAMITRSADAPALRFFHVEGGGHLILRGMTLRGGSSRRGGIFNQGEATIVRSTDRHRGWERCFQ
jgi:hypothetical protein